MASSLASNNSLAAFSVSPWALAYSETFLRSLSVRMEPSSSLRVYSSGLTSGLVSGAVSLEGVVVVSSGADVVEAVEVVPSVEVSVVSVVSFGIFLLLLLEVSLSGIRPH